MSFQDLDAMTAEHRKAVGFIRPAANARAGLLAERLRPLDRTRADLATRATVINSLIASRTLNPNEGRSWLGLPPRDGGDEFLNPNISAAPAAEVSSESGKNLKEGH